MNIVSITIRANASRDGRYSVFFVLDKVLLMQYKDVAYGAFDWVCIGMEDGNFDWLTWLESRD